MNYIELINNVWNMREQGIISTREQDLYLYLLHRSNVLFWKNPFHQSTTVLCSVLSIDRNTLITRRKRLKKLRLIDYEEGKAKNRPAKYTINRLNSNEPANSIPESSASEKGEKTQDTSKRTKGNENRFSPPSTGDVEKYCHERNNTVDAQRFVDFYTAKGWMLGKNKMKDWEAAIRTWEKGGKQAVQHPATNYKRQNRATDERF